MKLTPEERRIGRIRVEEGLRILAEGRNEWARLDSRQVKWLLKSLGKGDDAKAFYSWSDEERIEFVCQMRKLERFCAKVAHAALFTRSAI
jgi:hypothetical protein